VVVVLTLVQTKQLRIIIHKRNNTKNTVQKIQNTVNTSTHIKKHPHIHPPTHYTSFKNTVQDTPNEIDTKQSITLSIKSP
jgi:hypothetical protein